MYPVRAAYVAARGLYEESLFRGTGFGLGVLFMPFSRIRSTSRCSAADIFVDDEACADLMPIFASRLDATS
mgnify:CR=1 FL=1